MLATLLLDPDRAWYLSDLARHLNLTPSTLQRELGSLTDANILASSRDGNRTYYRADADCPVLADLRGLFIKTVGLADLLREALIPIEERIRSALIYGSFAAGEPRSSSDVDLLAVGSVALADLAAVLRPIEERILRPINPSLYSCEEFRSRIARREHFLTQVVAGPKLFMIGADRDLAAIASDGTAGSAPDEQEGN